MKAGERATSIRGYLHSPVTEYLIDHNTTTGYAQTIIETAKNASNQSTKRTTYTFGPDEITQTVSTLNPSNGTVTGTPVTSIFGHDGHGSTRVLIDATATIAQIYTYSAYGELLAKHNASGAIYSTATKTSLLYNGEAIDSRTGLYNFRARWYSPNSGRFERLDPFGGSTFSPFSYHKYGFVHSDPIANVDPTGKFLIAIDGTGTENWLTSSRTPHKLPNNRWLSHVRNFYEDYVKNGGKAHYDFGPSSEITGSDAPRIENEAFAALEAYMRESPTHLNEPIDMIGWSRGAYSVMRLAERLKRGLTFYTPYRTSFNVRFLGLYDPVDMSMIEGSGSLGTDNYIQDNVQNVVWLHGREGNPNVDHDSDSPIWQNWPRVKVRWSPSTHMLNMPLAATHGAIGGTPGYSDDRIRGYDWGHDSELSMTADIIMRREASRLGLPIPVLQRWEYGFPIRQSDLPAVRSSGISEFFGGASGVSAGVFSFSFGMGF